MPIRYRNRFQSLRSAVKLLSLPLLLLGLTASPAEAQTRERGPLVLELPANTKALALGNAFALGFQDPDAVFYHPGLLNRAQGMAVSVQRFGEASTLAAFSAGTSWYKGGVVLGAQLLTYGADAGNSVEAEDILALSDDPGSIRDEGSVGVSEMALSLGYGQTVKGIRMGVVGKLVEQRFGNLNVATAAADFGMAFSPGPLTVGLAVQNLGSALDFGDVEIPLPVRFNLGATSRRRPVGPLDLAASTAVSYRMDGDVIPSAGVEVAYWPVSGRTFLGRVGYRYLPDHWSGSPVTFGGAFFGDNIVLEYAYEGFDSGDPSHRVSVGWR